jgi:hypothetical protein
MANVPEPATCQECGKPLPTQQGRGRQRRYCDATCRSAARRDRASAATGSTAPHVNEDLTNPVRKSNLDVMTGEHDQEVLVSAERFVKDWSDRADSPLDAVTSARRLAATVDEALRAAVLRARGAGHTWQTIGELLGTSRQAAFQRFGRPVEDLRTDGPVPRRLVPGAAENAVALLVDYLDGHYERVRQDFDDTMLDMVDEAKLTEIRARLADLVGRYEGMGAPFIHAAGEMTVVDVPLRFEAGDMTGQVSYRPDGRVAGLFVTRPNTG